MVSAVDTVVDRITPRATVDDLREVLVRTGIDDRCPVVAEPYREWVLSGSFAAGRPCWEDAGAVFVADLEPDERRKLWLLNGGHSLLAYAGSIAGLETVAEAVRDERCAAWLRDWWDLATAQLADGTAQRYRERLLERWGNPRIRHTLAQIAADGSQKLPVRILPVLRAERGAGRLPAGATRVLAAWICHLRGRGAPLRDVRGDEYRALAAGTLAAAVARVLERLDPGLGADPEVVAVTVEQARELELLA